MSPLEASTESSIVCDCKQANHTHGEHAMYSRHKCRCKPCKKSQAEKHQRLHGNNAPVPAKGVCTKVNKLVSKGFTKLEIAQAAGISPATLNNLIRNNGVDIKVRRSTAELIMEVNLSQLVEARKQLAKVAVSPRAALNKVQALLDEGFTKDEIAKAAQISGSTIGYLMERGERGLRLPLSTAELILNVDVARMHATRNAGKKVAADKCEAARLRLQELHSVGWSIKSLAEQTGVAETTMSRLLKGQNISERTAAQISDMFRKLRLTQPPMVSDLDLARASRAMKLARQNKWDPMMTEHLKAAA